jgi:D-hexose-6-phosphate mutarotase
MKVSELIELLKECNQEMDVYFEYTYDCIYTVDERVKQVEDRKWDAVYIK